MNEGNEKQDTTSVLLVDDHGVVRNGIRALLENTGEFEIAAEACDGTEAVASCKARQPNLVLMDIGLPGLNGVEATNEIQRSCPGTKVVMLSMFDDEETVVSAMRAGARGFVLKQASMSDLIDALRAVARGGSYLSPAVSDRLLARIQAGTLDSENGSSVLKGLSRREVQVLRLIAEGKGSKEIAVLLALELETVRSYRKTMMRKLGVCNAASLTKIAVETGLVKVTPASMEPHGGR